MAVGPPKKEMKDMNLDELVAHFDGHAREQILLSLQAREQYIDQMRDSVRTFASLLDVGGRRYL